jgi:nucleoid-associated protein YgaU
VKAKNAKNWTDTIAGATKTLAAVAEIEKLYEAQQAKDAEVSLAKAKERLDWATAIDAKNRFPEPYTKASTAYSDAVKAKNAKNWTDAAAGVDQTLAAVAEIEKLYTAQKIQETDRAIAVAKERLDWATAIGAKTFFPEPYTKADTAYHDALEAKDAEDWDGALVAANKVLTLLAEIDALNEARIARMRKAQETDRAIAAAKERLDWAASIGAGAQFHDTFMEAENAYKTAVEARGADDLDAAQAAAERVTRAIARIEVWKREEANGAIVAAKERLDWAASIHGDTNFPDAYRAATTAYAEAVQARSEQDWEKTIAAANRVLDSLASVHEIFPLPAQYRVRTWLSVRDCLWNIAGYPWVYNDPFQWRRLYEANRLKLPDIDNPNFVLPDIILDIPSIRGETREGLWDENRSYGPLPP